MSSLVDVKRGKKDTILTFVKESFEDHRLRMTDIHREWALTLAWTRGHQNVNFNAQTRKWERPKVNPWQSRLVANKMLPIVRNKVARLAVKRSVWDVIPATHDQLDIDISRTGTKILRDKWSKLDMTTKMIRTLFWQENCSSAFIKVGWDTNVGPTVETDPALADPDILQQFLGVAGIEDTPKVIKTRVGKLFVEPIPPFNMAFDPLAAVYDDSDWTNETQLRSLDWITDNFGNQWKDKLSESDEIDILISPFLFTDTNTERKNVKGIMTHELFIRPGKRFEKGIHCLIADDQFLIGPKDFPFNHGLNPYVQFISIFDPVSVWGTCAAQQVRPQQAKYNRIQSAIMDHIQLTAKVQWLVPHGSVRTITNKPGEMIQYKGGVPPTQTQPKSLPSFLSEELERTGRNIQDTASVHSVSQGSNETGVSSGRQVLALQDADDAVEAPNLLFFNASLAKVGILVLNTLNQFVTEEEIIKVTGEFNEIETLQYTGAMLKGKGKGDYFDVRVKTLAGQTLSRSGRETFITNLLNLQLLHPERDKDLIFDMLGAGDIGLIFDQEEVEKTRQWNEIQKMLKGEQVTVMVGEDHDAHRKAIKKFFSSSQRDKAKPEALELIQVHYTQHLQMEATEFAQEQSIIQGALNGPQRNGQQQQQSGGTGSGNQNPSQSGRNLAASNSRTGVNTGDGRG